MNFHQPVYMFFPTPAHVFKTGWLQSWLVAISVAKWDRIPILCKVV